MVSTTDKQPGFLKSKHPVNFPTHPALWYSQEEFQNYILTHVRASNSQEFRDVTASESSTVVNEAVESQMKRLEVRSDISHPELSESSAENARSSRDTERMTRTANRDLAFATTEPLVDLFFALNGKNDFKSVSEMLHKAWNQDALTTLKVILNSRSIHVGKGSRIGFYQCVGWLAKNHPATLLLNLQWIVRPMIEKKIGEKRKREEEDDAVIVEVEKNSDDSSRFDVVDGCAHACWKDLADILVLAVEDKFHDPKGVLNIKDHGKRNEREWDPEKAQEKRHQVREKRHSTAIKAFENDSFYSALHMTIARIFADQLKIDLKALHGDGKGISLCAKWAPSNQLFHDRHTFINSTISSLLHDKKQFPNITDPEVYIRYAREAYRKDLSALRTKLGVVEQKIAANRFQDIKYERVCSLAMARYVTLFDKKDHDRFDQYLAQVAAGSKTISGAVLLPSTLVSKVRNLIRHSSKGSKVVLQAKAEERVIDGQWKSLVKRIKDSGTLQDAIAVADVSGSMTYPRFSDESCPMDSAIGLSMLVAEITPPPFGGRFITFSEDPTVQKIQGDSFKEKVQSLERSDWGMNTDFVKAFTLILDLAKEHKVSQDGMIKRVFVFSDMAFDSACEADEQWTTSFERIQSRFKDAGYEVPELVFWNLAADSNGTSAKPVSASENGVQLASGYSQGLMKVFLDNGAFVDSELTVEVEAEDMVNEAGDDGIVNVTTKKKIDPASTVRQAVGHESYAMLIVFD